MWPLKPLAELRTCRDEVLSRRRGALPLIINGEVDEPSLDRLFDKSDDWVPYVVPIVNVLISVKQKRHESLVRSAKPGGRPRSAEKAKALEEYQKAIADRKTQ